MISKKFKLLTSAAAALVLVACGSATDTSQSSQATSQSSSGTGGAEVTFPLTVDNEGTAIQGGTLRYALVSDSPFAGTFASVHYDLGTDGDVLAFLDEAILDSNANNDFTQDGMATWEYNNDTKTMTIKLKSADYKWSDGQPLTIDDYIYSFEVIGHPDYKGLRYSDTTRSIVGMEAYHNGEADTISGIKKVDDLTVEITFTSVTPSLFKAGGLWASATPKHVFKDIPVADQPSSDAVRKNPVGLGVFRVTNIVDGESVTAEANPHYWKGQAKVKDLVIDVVSSATIADEMSSGNYDLTSMPNSAYEQFKDMQNVTLLGQWTNIYTYIGFKLGKWDAEQQTNVMDPNAKMADKSLRQAMGYAVDNDLVSQRFYHGLRKRANSHIVPFFESLHDASLTGYTYDLEKAKKLLDDAGFKDVDGDGVREDKQGQKLTINFAAMSGDNVAEPVAQYYVQQWKSIGLDVQLTDGRLIELKTFYERVEADDPSFDVYQAAWGTGSDPYPDFWAVDGTNNYTRYNTEEHRKLLEKLNSEEALDPEKAKEFYKEWQAFANEEAFAIPTLYRTAITVVNKRVKHYDITRGTSFGLHELELLQDTGVSE